MSRILLLLLLAPCSLLLAPCTAQTLKSALSPHFLIGVAVNSATLRDGSPEADLVSRHFNSIVAENCMKAGPIHPREDRYQWEEADQTVLFGTRHGMAVIGHCLVWHSQAPGWMFKDNEGQEVSRDTLISRMRRHIHTVVSRYRGLIRGWDVVNEAINDDGTLRASPYLRIIGPEYIELAFRFAHEADPDAELYYNDYSMALPAKRETACRLVRQLKQQGCRIDAVGMQSHLGLTYPDLDEYERTMQALIDCGVKVQVTELDVSVLPNPWDFHGADIAQHFDYDQAMNPYTEGLPDSVYQQLEDRYLQLFRLYRRHERDLLRVTLWGLSDAHSWLNGFPIHGRTNYPLLFDRQLRPKPVVEKIIQYFDTE